jgi:hypothetical protein
VPVDRRESLEGELTPIFAHLEPVQRECARITDEATAEAQSREAEATARAHDLVARARTESEAERADAAAAARATATRETEQTLAEAHAAAQRLREWGEQHRPQLLARVLDLVRADLRALADDATGQGHGR